MGNCKCLLTSTQMQPSQGEEGEACRPLISQLILHWQTSSACLCCGRPVDGVCMARALNGTPELSHCVGRRESRARHVMTLDRWIQRPGQQPTNHSHTKVTPCFPGLPVPREAVPRLGFVSGTQDNNWSVKYLVVSCIILCYENHFIFSASASSLKTRRMRSDV